MEAHVSQLGVGLQSTIGLPTRPARNAEPQPQLGDYRFLKVIGSGTFGTVWLAEEQAVGVFRAIKVLRPGRTQPHTPLVSNGTSSGAAAEPAAARQTDASSAAGSVAAGSPRLAERELAGLHAFQTRALGHPHLIQIFKTGFCTLEPDVSVQSEEQNRSAVYYVMEIADHADSPRPCRPGDYRPLTMSALLRKSGRLPSTQVLARAAELLDAIDHLHRAGIQHRDIKPSNVLFVDGVLKLADLGLVSVENNEPVGTSAYMLDGRPDDLFALGVMMYEMATGLPARSFPDWPRDLDPSGDPALKHVNALIKRIAARDAQQRLSDLPRIRDEIQRLRAVPRSIRIAPRRAWSVAALIFGLGIVLGVGAGALMLRRGYPYERRTARAPYDGTEIAQHFAWNGMNFVLGRRHRPHLDVSITEGGTIIRFWDLQTRLVDQRLEVQGKFQIYNDRNPLSDDITVHSGEINQIYLVVGDQKVLLYHGQQGREPGTFGCFGRSIPLSDLATQPAGDLPVALVMTPAKTPQQAEALHLQGEFGPLNSPSIARLIWRTGSPEPP
jgi:serine/threonine protein kinase